AISLGATDKEVYTQAGLCQFQNKNYAEAVVALDGAVKAGASGKELFAARGNAMYYQKNSDGALQDLEKAIAAGQSDVATLGNLARIKFSKRDYSGAIKHLDAAIRVSESKDASLIYLRGQARLESGDAQASLADFDKAIQINSALTDAYSGRGKARFALKNYEGALADLEKIPQESVTAETSGMMGTSAWLTKDSGKAAKYLEAALKQGSKEPKVLLYAG